MKKIMAFGAALILLAMSACSSDAGNNDVTVTTTSETTVETANTSVEVNSELPNDEDETTAQTVSTDGVIKSGMTELYKAAFLTYSKGVGSMPYSEAKTYAESLGFEAECTEDLEDDINLIIINDTSGAYVWVMSYPDDNNTEIVNAVSYHHDDYEISISDYLHHIDTPQYIIYTYDKSSDLEEIKVSSLQECELFMFGESSDTLNSSEATTEVTTTVATTTTAATTTAVVTTTADKSYLSNNTIGATSGEKEALESALSYLSIMAFSREGLIHQLEYEEFSYSEAVYAADNCGADWNEQAVKKAKEYLDILSFSKQELIDQLEYDGFTPSQAEYGADIAYN